MKRLELKGPWRGMVIGVLVGVICLSIYQIGTITARYRHEAAVRLQMEKYRPAAAAAETEDAPPIVNQSVLDARETNGDIVGWLTMEDTRMDYPFVWAQDNDYYLRRDINGETAYAGTIFMDYRCPADFSGFSTVLYGHNMKGGSMFSDLRRYSEADFFQEHDQGWLYLPDATYRVDPFAYLLVRSDDSNIYAFDLETDRQRLAMLAYIQKSALNYRELSLSPHDKLLVLSTCAYDFNKARNVVVARLVAMPGSAEPGAAAPAALEAAGSEISTRFAGETGNFKKAAPAAKYCKQELLSKSPESY